MNHVNLPLIDAIVAKAVQTIPESDQQEISNPAWGFAKMLAQNAPLMLSCQHGIQCSGACQFGVVMCNNAILSGSLVARDWRGIFEDPAHFYKTKLGKCGMNLGQTCLEFAAIISTLAMIKMPEFFPQALANMAWAAANFSDKNSTVLNAIASKSMEIMAQFNHQNMANLLWLVAFFSFVHEPLLDVGSFATVAMTDFPAQELVNIA